MNLFSMVFLALITLSPFASAQQIKHIHFLIPGGEGGGWDNTAKSVAKVLKNSNLVESVSLENMSGDGGSKALSYLIKTAKTQKNTLMINSTPIVIDSLQRAYHYSFKDLTPIASLITDYQVLAVRVDSKMQTFQDVLNKLNNSEEKLHIGGGSNRGGMDHLIAMQVFKSANQDIKQIHYISYDAGGEAYIGLLNKDIDILSTGLSEVLNKHKKGDVRIIGITSSWPIEQAKDIPTFKSMGINVSFSNWRGFFGPPGLNEQRVKKTQEILKLMLQTPQWKNIEIKNGWDSFYKEGDDFKEFLLNQEKGIGSMTRVGNLMTYFKETLWI